MAETMTTPNPVNEELLEAIPTVYAPAAEGVIAALRAILVEEDRLHPIGCATWELDAYVAIENAVAEIERLSAIAKAESSGGGRQPIETAPFELGVEPFPDDRWLSWCLLGRYDEHGWVAWVGGMDAGCWLIRDDNRACADCAAPTHWFPLPPAPPRNSAEETR